MQRRAQVCCSPLILQAVGVWFCLSQPWSLPQSNGDVITCFECLLWQLFREWHIVSAQYMVTHSTTTNTTTIIFIVFINWLSMDDQRPLGVGSLSRLFVTPEDVSSTWVCKSHWRSRPQWPGSLDHPSTSGADHLSVYWPPWLLSLAFELWAMDESKLTQESFRNDWLNRAFKNETAEGWFCSFQNSLYGTLEMAELLFRSWHAKVKRQRLKPTWKAENPERLGLIGSCFSADYSVMGEHVHWEKTGKPQTQKKIISP